MNYSERERRRSAERIQRSGIRITGTALFICYLIAVCQLIMGLFGVHLVVAVGVLLVGHIMVILLTMLLCEVIPEVFRWLSGE